TPAQPSPVLLTCSGSTVYPMQALGCSLASASMEESCRRLSTCPGVVVCDDQRRATQYCGYEYRHNDPSKHFLGHGFVLVLVLPRVAPTCLMSTPAFRLRSPIRPELMRNCRCQAVWSGCLPSRRTCGCCGDRRLDFARA